MSGATTCHELDPWVRFSRLWNTGWGEPCPDADLSTASGTSRARAFNSGPTTEVLVFFSDLMDFTGIKVRVQDDPGLVVSSVVTKLDIDPERFNLDLLVSPGGAGVAAPAKSSRKKLVGVSLNPSNRRIISQDPVYATPGLAGVGLGLDRTFVEPCCPTRPKYIIVISPKPVKPAAPPLPVTITLPAQPETMFVSDKVELAPLEQPVMVEEREDYLRKGLIQLLRVCLESGRLSLCPGSYLVPVSRIASLTQSISEDPETFSMLVEFMQEDVPAGVPIASDIFLCFQ